MTNVNKVRCPNDDLDMFLVWIAIDMENNKKSIIIECMECDYRFLELTENLEVNK